MKRTLHRFLLLAAIFLLAGLLGCSPQVEPDIATSTPSILTSTLKPQPTRVITKVLLDDDPSLALIATSTRAPTATRTPTKTPNVFGTPVSGPEGYELRPRDLTVAYDLIKEAQDSIAEAYSNFLSFFLVTLVHEVWLQFPDTKDDLDLLRLLAKEQSPTISYTPAYGSLFDYSVEPTRLLIERGLNEGLAKPASLKGWMEGLGFYLYRDIGTTTQLFEDENRATVLQVDSDRGWSFFVIRERPEKQYSVYSLRPTWRPYTWNNEEFKITDLNVNGRDEIAILYDGWGAGMTRTCWKEVSLYEWDGTAFQELISTPLNISFFYGKGGDCLEVSFPADPKGGFKIQAGTETGTLCGAGSQLKVVTYSWNGEKFNREPDEFSSPPGDLIPSQCTIDWARKAGAHNDAAIRLMEAALANWPEEANQYWGPASQDYFKVKLAAWKLQRGDVRQGLALLREVRDNPKVPAFPLPGKVAASFLYHQATYGFYRAVREATLVYHQAYDEICESPDTCSLDIILEEWGFAEHEWDSWLYSPDPDQDFLDIPSFDYTLMEASPSNMDELAGMLERNGLQLLWSIAADLDGDGDTDWLVEVERTYGEYQYRDVYAILREGLQYVPHELYWINTYGTNRTDIRKWGNFTPGTGDLPVNVLQYGDGIYAFRLQQVDGEIKDEFDIKRWRDVLDWRVEDDRLIVTDEGRESIYIWSEEERKMVPTGYTPELQEQNIGKAEQALFIEDNPVKALELLNHLLDGKILEEYTLSGGPSEMNLPYLRPYVLYLRGLAYERMGDDTRAVESYWQVWNEYPNYPYTLAARSKLTIKE